MYQGACLSVIPSPRALQNEIAKGFRPVIQNTGQLADKFLTEIE